MTIHIGIGFSQEPNTSRAAREAALQAKTQTEQQTVDLALVFSTAHYHPTETLRVVRQTLKETKILGCSTAGIILSESVQMQGIAVLALHSKDIRFGIGHVNDIDAQDLRLAGNELARNAIADFGQGRRNVFIMLTDGLLRNNSRLIQGVQGVFGKAFQVVGAGSSDNFHFKETFQYFQEQPMTHSAVALLMGGQVSIGVGSNHGWKPLGKPRIADSTENEIIKTLDGKKASSIYEEYFGVDLKELQSADFPYTASLYPLGVYVEGESEYLLRSALEVRNDGSIVCQGEVPQDAEVHMMLGNKDFCKHAAKKSAREVKEALLGKKPQLIIVFESLSRYKLLGRSAFQEIQTIKEVFGPTVPIIGMYAYGEIAPLKSFSHIGEAYLQNETITILGIA